MPVLDALLRKKIDSLELNHQRRSLRQSQRGGVHVQQEGREYVSFSCNDYLGLSAHPEVKKAAAVALEAYGAGAGASRLVTGNHPLYAALEQKIAAIKGAEAAIIFGSGYLANLGVIPALMARGDLIIADRLVHACIIDAAQLSGAKLLRFQHNDLPHCEELLRRHRGEYKNCLLVTDGVFSMDGDIAPLPQLSALAKTHDAWLMSDDAHGLGVVGGGRGSSFAFDKKVDVDIQMGTFSKAGGSYGGYICASQTVVEYLVTAARSVIYSTALPPSVVAASLAALDVMEREPERVAAPLAKAQRFTAALMLPPAQSAIVPLLLGESATALAASEVLKDHGFLAAAIRPPTVPEHTARLRFAFSALHADADIDRLVDIIKQQGWALTCAA